MAETLDALSQKIEEHRGRRPVKPEGFDPYSPAGRAFIAELQTWANDLDELQAEFNGVFNRMVFCRQAPAARTFTHAPMRFRQ